MKPWSKDKWEVSEDWKESTNKIRALLEFIASHPEMEPSEVLAAEEVRGKILADDIRNFFHLGSYITSRLQDRDLVKVTTCIVGDGTTYPPQPILPPRRKHLLRRVFALLKRAFH